MAITVHQQWMNDVARERGQPDPFPQCVILFRNTQNGAVGFVSDGESDRIAVFDSEEQAEREAPGITICRAFPYQIVRLEDI